MTRLPPCTAPENDTNGFCNARDDARPRYDCRRGVACRTCVSVTSAVRQATPARATHVSDYRMISFPPPLIAHYKDARALSLLLLLAIFIAGIATAAQDTAMPAPPFAADVEQRVTALTNDFRKQNGLPPLEPESRLAETARYFAGYLATSGKLDHDADGATPPDRVKNRGYNYCAVAENLASEYSSAGFAADTLSRNLVQGWRDSPT